MLFRRTQSVHTGTRGEIRQPSRLPLWIHISLWLLAGVCIAALSLAGMWQLFGRPRVSAVPPALDPNTLFDALKISLSLVAGIGGVAALVIAYRRQRLNEAEHLRQEAAARREDARLFSERFSRSSEQLASDKVAMRLAGVYALAGLADDWEEGRQTCIDVLCAYLRMPYRQRQQPPDLGVLSQYPGSPVPAWLGRNLEEGHDPEEEHQVRLAVMRVITNRLNSNAGVNWFGYHFDFTGAVFEDADFNAAHFVDCRVEFDYCLFYGESWFSEARIIGSDLSFLGAVIAGRVSFELAYFEDSEVWFTADIVDGELTLYSSEIVSGELHFTNRLKNGHISLVAANIKGGKLRFGGKLEDGTLAFSRSILEEGAEIHIQGGEYSSGTVYFNGVDIRGGELLIDSVDWAREESWTKLSGTEFSFDGVVMRKGKILVERVILDGSEFYFQDLLCEYGSLFFVDVILRRGALRFRNSQLHDGRFLIRGVIVEEAEFEVSGLELARSTVKVGPSRLGEEEGADPSPEISWVAAE